MARHGKYIVAKSQRGETYPTRKRHTAAYVESDAHLDEDYERPQGLRRGGVRAEVSTIKGVVVTSQRNLWTVQLPDASTSSCTLRGRLRGRVHPVVGDEVEVSMPLLGAQVIEAIRPRRTELTRRTRGGQVHVLAANVDQVVLAMSSRTPPFRAGAVERLLVYASESGTSPIVLLTKADLVTAHEAAALLQPWAHLDVILLPVSVRDSVSVDRLRTILAGRTSVLVGPSGVGKSTIVNLLCTDVNVLTGVVSAATSKGRHTTTSSRLFALETGGFLVDTPGIKELGLFGVNENDLLAAFPDVLEHQARCAFRSCTHDMEAGCAVEVAVRGGILPAARLKHYRAFLEELRSDA